MCQREGKVPLNGYSSNQRQQKPQKGGFTQFSVKVHRELFKLIDKNPDPYSKVIKKKLSAGGFNLVIDLYLTP